MLLDCAWLTISQYLLIPNQVHRRSTSQHLEQVDCSSHDMKYKSSIKLRGKSNLIQSLISFSKTAFITCGLCRKSNFSAMKQCFITSKIICEAQGQHDLLKKIKAV